MRPHPFRILGKRPNPRADELPESQRPRNLETEVGLLSICQEEEGPVPDPESLLAEMEAQEELDNMKEDGATQQEMVQEELDNIKKKHNEAQEEPTKIQEQLWEAPKGKNGYWKYKEDDQKDYLQELSTAVQELTETREKFNMLGDDVEEI